MKKRLSDIFYSFPVQLLVVQARSNLLLLFLWVLLFLMISGNLGKTLGILYLFLDPEYLGKVGFWSFFFIGLAYGGFFMTWNLTIYLLNAHRFPFLASLARPFAKFCLNNAIIPLAFFIFYLGTVIDFQLYHQYLGMVFILKSCLGLITGVLFLGLIYMVYFHFTNRDISYYNKREKRPPNLIQNITPGKRGVDIDLIKLDKNRWRVDTYLTEALRPRLVRSVAHYDSSLLSRIFKQNHLNALIVQLFSLLGLVLLGSLMEYPAFRIPAGASIFILGSTFIAITGAVIYWFHAWRTTILILLLFGINFLTSYEVLTHKNKAYGLSYEEPLPVYDAERLNDICNSEIIERDKSQTTNILNNWLEKHQDSQPQKPKMVIFAVSGGGLKAAIWSMQVMRKTDLETDGKLMTQTALITGASGGMIGMGYLRELYLRKIQGQLTDPYSDNFIDKMSKDLLNSIAFAIVTNDIYMPWMTFEVNGNTYYKDRGFILEKQLNENTDNVLNKTIAAYQIPEANADIPMMYITPAILNDARRLIISPQDVSFMMIAPIGLEKHGVVETDAVDFRWLLKEQEADSLLFTSALRMNATYPYVLPNVYLPTNPGIEVMDAGFRDNFGLHSATRFIQVFQDWILENTSGVVLVQVRAFDRPKKIAPSDFQGTISAAFNPLGIATQVLTLQEFEHDSRIGFLYDMLGKEHFHLLRFTYYPTEDGDEKASISFHITEREKRDVLNAFYLAENQKSMETLKNLLK